MNQFLGQFRSRPRLMVALAAGAAVVLGLALAGPKQIAWTTSALLGWNAFVWIYLALVLVMMSRADHRHVQRHSRAIADGVLTVLLLAVVGAVASLGALAMELSQARAGASLLQGGAHMLLTLGTVAGSWLLLPVEFGLAYASLYHRGHAKPCGLEFPGIDADGAPDYSDFMYFSVTVAATSQTSDIAVSSRAMRRLVLFQAILSFAFNTGVLALAINVVAGLLA